MNISRGDSIRVALAYADIFSYPLRREEAVLWRVGRAGTDASSFTPPESRLVALRSRRERWSSEKWPHVHRAAALLRLVPGMRLVGVTGGLAMNNADRKDDIDFFCLTSRGTMWSSRLLATLLLDCFGLRRRPGELKVADKICLNMFMQQGSWALPSSERDLFAAHEVLQLVPVWEAGGAYHQFLAANSWVKRFLPNAWNTRWKKAQQENKISPSAGPLLTLLRAVESGARWIQVRHMKPRRTTEVIRAGVLRFHPHDVRPWVRSEFEKRLRRLGIPLDKIFYGR